MEISDAEVAELRQAHALLKSLYADNTVGFDFRKLVKKKFPAASIPELDAIVKTEELTGSLDARFKEIGDGLTKKIDNFLEARVKEREDADVDAYKVKFEKVVKDRGYTKEGTEHLVSLMKERGIQDPEDAAVIFEARQPKAPVKPRQFSSRMQFVEPDGENDDSFKRLMADPEQWMGDELMTAFQDANKEE